MKTQDFFPSNMRAVTLALPLSGLLAVVVYLFVRGPGDFTDDAVISRFILNIFTMNALHLGFPFVLLLVLPAGRELVRSKIAVYGFPQMVFAASVIVLGIYFLSVTSLMEQSFFSKKTAAQILTWAFLVLPTIHGTRQSLGISLLLTRSISTGLTPMELTRVEKITLWERRLTAGLCFFIIVGWCANSFRDLQPAFASVAVFVKLGAAVISGAIASTLVFIFWREPVFNKSGKTLFAARLLLSPFGLYCQLAIWLLSLIHTQEYLMLLSKFLISAKCPKLKINLIVGIIFSVLVLLPIFSVEVFFRWFETKSGGPYPAWSYFLLALWPSITLLHYAADGMIYRMRDPHVRQTLGAAILSSQLAIK